MKDHKQNSPLEEKCEAARIEQVNDTVYELNPHSVCYRCKNYSRIGKQAYCITDAENAQR